ncbi:MAG: hypothetical protein IKN31_03495 [Bacteroidales bacterium]|nr:hypothetical protein [Bacteroidales bacterium]
MATSGLYRAIWKQIYPILNSRGANILKLVFGGAIKAVSKCIIDLNGDGQTDDISSAIDVESFIKLFIENDKALGNRILVFDDLERCLVPTEQLFGILNQFTEHSNCKVILIANEEKLVAKAGENAHYSQIKEKLVGQTFKFDVEVSDSVRCIISDSKNAHLATATDMILDIFTASKLQNLRSLKIALQSFGIFCNLIDDKYKEQNDVYQEFVKNVLAYFLICSFELSSGNMEIKEYQSFRPFLDERNEATKRDKYSECLSKYGIYSSHYSLPTSSICQFLTDGFIVNFDGILEKNMFFKNATQKDWERLWFYSNLENEELLRYVSVVRRNIARGDIDNIPTLLHSAGVLFRINNSKVLRINTKEVLRDSKKTIDNIISNAASPLDSSIYFSYESAYGKAYSGSGLPVFRRLTAYCAKRIELFRAEFRRQTCKRVWETLRDHSLEDVTHLIHRRDEILGLEDSNANIFSGVNLRIAANRISSLSNAIKVELYNNFLAYNGASRSSSEEIESMKELVMLLRKKANSLKSVDRDNILCIASEMEKCLNEH